jgi:ubiquinone/menaquinone biosynthesis C-methylase UbiE
VQTVKIFVLSFCQFGWIPLRWQSGPIADIGRNPIEGRQNQGLFNRPATQEPAPGEANIPELLHDLGQITHHSPPLCWPLLSELGVVFREPSPADGSTTRRESRKFFESMARSPLRFGLEIRSVLLFIAVVTWVQTPGYGQNPPQTQPVYATTRPSADGIGKVYMGREIARVMSHGGADWLERPDRENEEAPSKAIDLMELKPTDVVADIGAGTGYFSFRIAKRVPQGKVLAEDIDDQMIRDMTDVIQSSRITNVQTVKGTTLSPNLPAGAVDVVLMVDAYHEFDHPREMMESIVRSLKPGGRVIDLEYRAEDDRVLIKPHHKMTEAQAIREMNAVGLKHLKTLHDLPQQHFLVFQKPADR